jgi:hypothetical protein
MFDRLFVRPEALAHHRAEPLLEERLTFLAHLADRGLARSSLRAIAPKLLVIMKSLALARRPGEAISRDEIRQKVVNKFFGTAQRWLHFLGRLQQRPAPVSPYAKKIKAFADDMEYERGLSSATIRGRCWIVSRFLSRLDAADGSLRGMTPQCIDSTLQKMLSSGVYSRVTIQDWAYTLRAFSAMRKRAVGAAKDSRPPSEGRVCLLRRRCHSARLGRKCGNCSR